MLHILMISLNRQQLPWHLQIYYIPYTILQEFAVDNKVMVTSHHEAIKKLHAWRTNFDRILKRSTSIVYKLNSPWNLDISSVLSRDDAHLSTIGALIELTFFTVDPRPTPAPLPRFRGDVPVLLPPSSPWPDWDASCGEPSLDKVEFLRPRGKWWGYHASC